MKERVVETSVDAKGILKTYKDGRLVTVSYGTFYPNRPVMK